jgi:ubiquinone/menaquinone biosynthesis C-methylase UbiE
MADGGQSTPPGGREISGYYRDEFGRLARFYDRGLAAAFRLVGGEGSFRRAIVTAADIHPGQAVLDVNCGTGTLALMMADRVLPGGRVTGTDLAEKMLEVARRKAGGAGPEFVLANAEILPFDDGSFDRVTCSLAVHEMNREGRRNALAEMRRVLVPGGRLVIADLRRPDSWRTRLGMALVRLNETDTLTDMWRRGLDREMEAAGFGIIRRQQAGRGFFEILVARAA